MGKKGNTAQQLRKLREQERATALAKEKKSMIIIAASIVAAIALIVGITFLIIHLTKPQLPYIKTEKVTNYVHLNISYTSNDGVKHTGDIVVELDPENAPITVKNFQKLVGQGFYDGLIFHRIIETFMIQGGDPTGTGYGDPNANIEEIKGEFTENGVNNQHKHVEGTISMARSNDPNSASSQFFIVTETSAGNSYSLDGKYAAFGQVIYGMEHVKAIAGIKTGANDRPVTPPVINSAVFVIEK